MPTLPVPPETLMLFMALSFAIMFPAAILGGLLIGVPQRGNDYLANLFLLGLNVIWIWWIAGVTDWAEIPLSGFITMFALYVLIYGISALIRAAALWAYRRLSST